MPQLRGHMVFAFQLSKASGTMKRVARVGGSITDAPLERCLRERLEALPFKPSRDMSGTVAYQFDAKESAISRAP